MFRRVILAGASVIALTAAASAADLNQAPAIMSYKDAPSYGVNWSGVYIGVNSGYGWDASKIGDKTGPELGLSPEGGFGGGQIGLNWQRGNIVLGVEADIQAANITDSKTTVQPPAYPLFTIVNKSTLDWFGTLRGRAGYAFGSSLVYGTGGLAYGHITDESSCTAAGGSQLTCANPAKFTKETDATGYVVGGGVEHKFNPAWSVKAEYQYLNLGKDNFFADRVDEDYAVSTVRLGLNYHVGSGYEPLR